MLFSTLLILGVGFLALLFLGTCFVLSVMAGIIPNAAVHFNDLIEWMRETCMFLGNQLIELGKTIFTI